MNRTLMLGSALTLGVGALIAGAVVDAPGARAQGETPWLGSYAAAQTAARQAGKPIFLVFR